LDLPECLEQRLAVPQAHIVDGRAVGGNELPRQARFGAELVVLDPVERPCLPRRSDVIDDLRRLAGELVRLHDEPLIRGGHDRAEQRHRDVTDHRAQGHRHQAPTETAPENEHRANQGHDTQDVECGQTRVKVHVVRAGQRQVLTEQQAGDSDEVNPNGRKQQQQPRQNREVALRTRSD